MVAVMMLVECNAQCRVFTQAELKAADASNHVMAAWTGKDCFH